MMTRSEGSARESWVTVAVDATGDAEEEEEEAQQGSVMTRSGITLAAAAAAFKTCV